MASEEKLDLILKTLFTMQPTVEATARKLERLEMAMDTIRVNDAVQDQKIREVGLDVNGLGDKLRKHVESHWSFIAMVCGIVGTGVGLLKWLGDK